LWQHDFGAALAKMKESSVPDWWNGFAWSTVKAHIAAAEAELDKEPQSKPLLDYVPWDWKREAAMQEMQGLLAEMHILSARCGKGGYRDGRNIT
jgi:hypothetical protein